MLNYNAVVMYTFFKGRWLLQVMCLDEEAVALLPEMLDVLVQKLSLVAVLTIQYHSILVQAIKLTLRLVSYAKDIPQHPLNVNMVMFGLLMVSKKHKEELKYVLMAIGLLRVMETGHIHGMLVKLS